MSSRLSLFEECDFSFPRCVDESTVSLLKQCQAVEFGIGVFYLFLDGRSEGFQDQVPPKTTNLPLDH